MESPSATRVPRAAGRSLTTRSSHHVCPGWYPVAVLGVLPGITGYAGKDALDSSRALLPPELMYEAGGSYGNGGKVWSLIGLPGAYRLTATSWFACTAMPTGSLIT